MAMLLEIKRIIKTLRTVRHTTSRTRMKTSNIAFVMASTTRDRHFSLTFGNENWSVRGTRIKLLVVGGFKNLEILTI